MYFSYFINFKKNMNILTSFLFNKKHFSKNFNENAGKLKLDFFNFDLISRYFKNVIKYKSSFHIISDQIKDDLDFDDVFRFIDRTASKVGQQYLYYKIRTIRNIEALNEFEKLINIFETQKEKSAHFRQILSKLDTNNSYYFEELFHRKQIEKPKWLKLSYLLSFFAVLFIILSFFNSVFILYLLPVFSLNIFFHYKNKSNLNYYLSAVSEFYKSINIAKILEKDNEIRTHFKDLSFLKKIYKIRNKARFISFEKSMNNNELLAIVWAFSELIKIFFNIEIILFYNFIEDLLREKENINELFSFIGEIDAAISVASLREHSSLFCKPEFVQQKKIQVQEIIHPLIEDCIPNSLTLDAKSLLLTGSNMSGKTTFIRTISINSILAQTINTCFAKEYKAPFLKIFSSIRISDNILEDTSYFLKEVLIIRNFIEQSDSKETCLFVLDEIFKGTNTQERISAGYSILSFLNKNQHIVIVSTHDIELTEMLDKQNYELYNFSEQIIDNKLIFDHKLKPGKLKTRNAIKILELCDYPKKVIDDAKSALSFFDKEKI